jgi:hypothetical protein
MFLHKQNKWKYNEHMSLFSDMVKRRRAGCVYSSKLIERSSSIFGKLLGEIEFEFLRNLKFEFEFEDELASEKKGSSRPRPRPQSTPLSIDPSFLQQPWIQTHFFLIRS